MGKTNSLKELAGYEYDYKYLQEKSKEIDAFGEMVNKSCMRLKTLEENNLPIDDLDEQLKLLINKQANEEERLLNIINKKQKIEDVINNLSQPYKTVLYLKYIRFLTFDQVADKMNYSTKRIYQLHKTAIEMFEKDFYGCN